MTKSDTIGYFIMMLSLVMLIGSFMEQIHRNNQRRSCGGISFYLIVINYVAWLVWAVHVFTKTDWFWYMRSTSLVLLIFGMIKLVAEHKRLMEEAQNQIQKWKIRRQMRIKKEIKNIDRKISDLHKGIRETECSHDTSPGQVSHTGLTTEDCRSIINGERWIKDLEKQREKLVKALSSFHPIEEQDARELREARDKLEETVRRIEKKRKRGAL